MPYARFTGAALYLVLVLGLAGIFNAIGVDSSWAFVVGAVVAILLTVALEARYRRRHPVL
jgi:hypothetical protein